MQSKRSGIRRKLTGLILTLTIVPLFGVTIFISSNIFNHLDRHTRIFYSELLQQVGGNIDFIYSEYLETLQIMATTREVVAGINAPTYGSKTEEFEVSRMITGDKTILTGLRKRLEEQIEGVCYIYELDRHSLINNTPYKFHMVFEENFLVTRYLDKMLIDPLYLRLQNGGHNGAVFGKFQDGVLSGTSSDTAVFIYPFKQELQNNNISKFILIVLFPNLLPNSYLDIEPLKYGTLYILDQDETIIKYNHPDSGEDYYSFNTDTGKYILGDDDPDDSFEKMSFSQYRALNVDPGIIKSDEVQEFLKKNESNPETSGNTIITHKGSRYIFMTHFARLSGVKLFYFHPLKQVYNPLYKIIIINFFIAICFSIAAVAVSLLFSRSFTVPIRLLVHASHLVSIGKYDKSVAVDTGDELEDLAFCFNSMVTELQDYQQKLVLNEREKTTLDIAKTIQTSLLPPEIKSTQFDLASVMIPADSVGGDYFDIIAGETAGRLWLGIGDVSGHGVAAGLIMMMAQTAFNTILLNDDTIHTNHLIEKVNRVLYQNIRLRLNEDHFMTGSFLMADAEGKVYYSGAHLDILIYRARERTVESIETKGLWLGILPDIKKCTKESSFSVEKDDVILLYTDGLIEIMNADHNQYDMDRLLPLFLQLGDKPVKEIRQSLLESVFEFSDNQMDDITLIVARKL